MSDQNGCPGFDGGLVSKTEHYQSETMRNGRGGASKCTYMGRRVCLFLFLFFLYFHCSAKASQVCAISQCQHLSVRLIQLRLRQLQRGRVTEVSLILPIASVPFVFSARVTAFLATWTGRRINCLFPEQLFWVKATVVRLFEVISKYIALSDMIIVQYVSAFLPFCFRRSSSIYLSVTLKSVMLV